ncbi:MAG: hypothetical protein K2Y71_03175 [Xanthobacteraceae bacterium]|nr:hypothetical protein [Xanthobacteraceae bacterium]
MTLPTKTLAAVLLAGSAIAPVAAPASAAPLSHPIALSNAQASGIEQVQYRRWHRGDRGIGPVAGFAAGAIIGGALAQSYYNDGYYAYGAAPGGYYAYGAAPGYVAPRYRSNWNYGNGSAATSPGSAPECPADRYQASGYPSWMCR